jgi:VanZ family protein
MAFCGLAFLLAWAIPKRSAHLGWHLLITWCIAITYASVDEFTQKFIPGRTSDIWDVVADGFGACIGLASYLFLRSTLLKFSLGRDLIQRLSR